VELQQKDSAKAFLEGVKWSEAGLVAVIVQVPQAMRTVQAVYDPLLLGYASPPPPRIGLLQMPHTLPLDLAFQRAALDLLQYTHPQVTDPVEDLCP